MYFLRNRCQTHQSNKWVGYMQSTQKLHYFIKSVKINHPFKCNIITIEDLYSMTASCESLYKDQVYKTIFLFDLSRHLSGNALWDDDSENFTKMVKDNSV